MSLFTLEKNNSKPLSAEKEKAVIALSVIRGTEYYVVLNLQ